MFKITLTSTVIEDLTEEIEASSIEEVNEILSQIEKDPFTEVASVEPPLVREYSPLEEEYADGEVPF